MSNRSSQYPSNMADQIQIRVHGEANLPSLVYLPGLHGDWTLISSFRAALVDKVRFVEIAYPRTTDWTLYQYERRHD